MPRDIKSKMSKKELSNKREYNLRNRKKCNEESSSDSSDDDEEEEEDEDEEIDVHEYRKLLHDIFPSKHLKNKIRSGDKLITALQNDKKNISCKNKKCCKKDAEEDEKEKVVKSKKIIKKTKKTSIVLSDSEEDDSDSEYIGSSDSDDDEDEEDEEDDVSHGNKFKITLTIGNNDEYDDEDEDWDTCSDDDDGEITEDEDEPVSSDSDTDTEDEEPVTHKKQKISKNKKQSNNDINELPELIGKSSEHSVAENEVLLTSLKEIQTKNKDNYLVNKCLRICEETIQINKKKNDKKMKKQQQKNERIFKRIIRDKNVMNDFDFYSKLDVVKQNTIIKELKEINKIIRVEKPYRLTLLESDIPVIFKAAAMKKISSLKHMEPGSGEYYKIKNWVDTFMRIPFNNYNNLPITIEDGVDKCHEFMASAQKTLNDAVYGLNDAKIQIMQMLGQLITNPKAIGTSIAIHGPPGTGKTSLVKEGISKILNRPFAFIALGGATDSSFLEGHGYTYEGSTWGKIVQILIDSKCMNPVIYFDELDKISDTPKGEEIAGILTHLTDTSQNSQFHDKYFTEIDFDLSKCLFIFSYNDESKINPILKDRMYRIQTTGYNQKQKTTISNNYLLPRIREQVKFTAADIIIADQTVHYIIENHCNKEDGVRNLKRCLEIIYTKLNLYRLMKPGANLFEEDMSIKVEFPFTVTKDIIDKLIKKTNALNASFSHLYT
jgi:ATP-dependent Lon protease